MREGDSHVSASSDGGRSASGESTPTAVIRTIRLNDAPSRPTLGLAAAILFGTATALMMVPSAGGAAATAGTEVITQPVQTKPLGSGGSATEYGVELPTGASCPGDTAHKGYRVYSFLIPTGVSLAGLDVRGSLPFRGQPGHPYYGFVAYGGVYYGAVNTDEDTGQIPTLPYEFTWSRLTSRDLIAAGEKSSIWVGGIACATATGTVTNYWSSEIEFTASSSDPHGFTWRVLDPPSPSLNLGLWISVLLIVLAVMFGAGAVMLSRRQREAHHVDQ